MQVTSPSKGAEDDRMDVSSTSPSDRPLLKCTYRVFYPFRKHVSLQLNFSETD